MQKKVLTEVDLYHGEIAMPKGFEIDLDKIRNDIIESYVKKNRINNNPQAYAFDDYVVPFSQPLQWMQDYMRDHWRVEYGRTLVTKTMHGNVMHPKEKSWTRGQVDPVDLRNSPDYTLIYGVDVKWIKLTRLINPNLQYYLLGVLSHSKYISICEYQHHFEIVVQK